MVNAVSDWLIRIQIMGSHFIVGKSPGPYECSGRRYGIPKDRMLVAPNTVDNITIRAEIAEARNHVGELRSVVGEGPIVLYVGAMEKTKNLETLLNAMPAVWAAVPATRLVLVGDGEVRPGLEEKARALDADGRVIFTGAIHEGVSRYFLLADVVVLPGLGGLAIPHAMIHGVPVIAGQADSGRTWCGTGRPGSGSPG